MEKAHLFGEENNLFGILSEPQPVLTDNNLPIILILNAGLIHHVGPFRMSVDISRLLVSLGYRVFRFDLSGIGDSKKRRQDSLPSRDRNLLDVGEVIKFLNEKYSQAKFVTLGLCTGADLAHRSAVKYEAVVGSVILDGYAYPTPLFYLKRYGPAYYTKHLKSIFMDYEQLKNVITRFLKKRSANKQKKMNFKAMEAYYWELPEKERYIQEMRAMSRANKKHFYIFSGGINYYIYENQYKDALKGENFLEDVSLKYYANSDHMFALNKHQASLFANISEWLDRTYKTPTS